MPNVLRERERSVFGYSPGGAIGRTVLCQLEGCLKGSRLVPSNRYAYSARRSRFYFRGRLAERFGLVFVFGVFESREENSASSQCFLFDLSCSAIMNTT